MLFALLSCVTLSVTIKASLRGRPMKTKKIRKTLSWALALATVMALIGTTGCSKKDHTTVNPSGTPETTKAPAEKAEDLFATGDKDYYVPFQNPDHSYSTINDGFGTPLRQQGKGGCYAYAAVATMQSGYRKTHGELIDINPVDIIDRIYENPDPKTGEVPPFTEEKFYLLAGSIYDLGGDITRVTGALCADPLNGYLISETNLFGSYNTKKDGLPVLTEQEVKDLIRRYGAICMSVNYRMGCKTVHGYYTQNYQKDDTDHVATIVGWDDDFPADCFATPASRNGAWLVQNSFGEYWGNLGYYWVSYDMAIPMLCNSSVTKEYSSAISYGRFSQSSLPSSDVMAKLGKEMDYTKISDEDILSGNDVVTASVYEKKGKIGAIGFWTSLPNQPYTIEIRDGEFGDVLATKSGRFEFRGYHTVTLDEPVSVKKFTVVVKTAGIGVFEGESTELNVYSVLQKLKAHYEAKTEAGRSFIQIGEEWVDITDPALKTRLGVDDVPALSEAKTPGDPCITVLFK